MNHDDLSWWIMMAHHDESWWVIMIHHDESSWIIMIHHRDESWWFIMMIHHNESSWFIMMSHHDSSWWFIMLSHDESSWFIMMNHHDSSWWVIMIHSSWWLQGQVVLNCLPDAVDPPPRDVMTSNVQNPPPEQPLGNVWSTPLSNNLDSPRTYYDIIVKTCAKPIQQTS